VFYLPLPPLPLREYDAAICAMNPSPKQRIVARTLLWTMQRNARAFSFMYYNLIAGGPSSWTEGLYQEKLDIAKTTGEFVRYVDACKKRGIPPVQLLNALFWPQLPVDEIGRFHPYMEAALLGEAAELCAIFRTVDGDVVYMHPTTAVRLCSYIETPLAVEVSELGKEMQLLPTQPKDETCGKLYERIITRGFVCRASCDPEFVNESGHRGLTLSKLLNVPVPGFPDDELQVPECPIRNIKLQCFPRATKRDNKGRYANEECSKMPTAEEAPFWCIMGNDHNLLVDSLLTVRRSKGKPVAIGFQMKEWQDGGKSGDRDVVQSFRGNRQMHFTWGTGGTKEEVLKFLQAYDFVHVLVTPNPVPATQKPQQFELTFGPETTVTCYEAFVTHADIRRWSPMLAYSACDARVLNSMIQSQEPPSNATA
jgi:hypothetical protein